MCFHHFRDWGKVSIAWAEFDTKSFKEAEYAKLFKMWSISRGRRGLLQFVRVAGERRDGSGNRKPSF